MSHQKAKYGKSKKLKWNSWLTAAFLIEGLLCRMVSIFINIPYISVLLMMCIVLILFFTNKKLRISKNLIFVFGIMALLLLGSGILNGIEFVMNYLTHFIVFGITALFITELDINYKEVLISLLKISLLYIIMYFLFERDIFVHSENYWINQMGLAYGFLIPAVVGMVVIWKRDILQLNKIEIILSLLCMILSIYIILVDCGTRGAIISIAVSFVLLLIEKEKSYKRAILVIGISIIIILFLNNIDRIILYIHQILSDVGIDIPALTKMISLMEENAIDNGRNGIYELSLKFIKESPLFGYGVGYFESQRNGSYVHNFFLQVLCEFGIVGLVFMLIPILNNFIKTFFKQEMDSQERTIKIMLFLITMPLLMFSSAYWLLPSFWLYFWYAIKTNDLKNDRERKLSLDVGSPK